MKPRAPFAYAQGRLQARLGQRPPGILWQRLQQAESAEMALHHARGHGPWREILAGLEPGSDPHRIEAALENRFAEEVEQAARWVPSPWAAAVARLRDLPGLPRASHRQAGRHPWPFLSERPAPEFDPPDFDPREDMPAGGATLLFRWLERWRESCPSIAPEDGVDTLIERIRLALAVEPFHPGSIDDLELDLARSCRAHLARAGAVLAYLALTALDLARLRGALLRARLLPGEAPP